MADTYEKDLAQKSSLTTSDFIRVVGSDNVSYKQGMASVKSALGVTETTIVRIAMTKSAVLTLQKPTRLVLYVIGAGGARAEYIVQRAGGGGIGYNAVLNGSSLVIATDDTAGTITITNNSEGDALACAQIFEGGAEAQ